MKQLYYYTHQIWGNKGTREGKKGAREGKKGTREGKKGAREGKKGAAPFYFGLAGTLHYKDPFPMQNSIFFPKMGPKIPNCSKLPKWFFLKWMCNAHIPKDKVKVRVVVYKSLNKNANFI